jgi:hypothetical protein
MAGILAAMFLADGLDVEAASARLEDVVRPTGRGTFNRREAMGARANQFLQGPEFPALDGHANRTFFSFEDYTGCFRGGRLGGKVETAGVEHFSEVHSPGAHSCAGVFIAGHLRTPPARGFQAKRSSRFRASQLRACQGARAGGRRRAPSWHRGWRLTGRSDFERKAGEALARKHCVACHSLNDQLRTASIASPILYVTDAHSRAVNSQQM